jgi:DNA polymerase III sliding clamp (beta) subunit (PCNA family)
MNYSFNTKEIKGFLSNASKVIKASNKISVLSNIHCSLENNKLTMIISNLDQVYINSFQSPLSVIDNDDSSVYKFLVNFKEFEFIIKSIKDTELILDFTDFSFANIAINSIPCSIELKHDAFPKVDIEDFNGEDVKTIHISSENKNVFVNANTFASDDEIRYFMNGIHIEINNNLLNIVATNGRILYVNKNIKSYDVGFEPVTVKTTGVSNILLKEISTIKISKDNKYVLFHLNDNSDLLLIKLDGQFPNYNRVIPEYRTPEYIYFNKELKEKILFMNNLAKVKKLTKKEFHTITYTVKKNTIELVDNAGNTASISYVNEFEFNHKEDFVFKFMTHTIIPVLNVIEDTTKVYFDVGMPSSYAFVGENSTGETIVFMPCSLT